MIANRSALTCHVMAVLQHEIAELGEVSTADDSL